MILATAKMLIALILALSVSAAVAVGTWTIIYHGLACRKHPIEKTALAAAGCLVIICAAVIKVL